MAKSKSQESGCTPAGQGEAPSPAGLRRSIFRLGLAILGPLLLLSGTEVVLRLADYGCPRHFFVKTQSGDFYLVNDGFSRFFQNVGRSQPHPCRFPVRKPGGGVRIFVLGESAAMGTPDPAFGFGRILETLLRQQYAGKPIEVINAAMRGINSYAVLPIARDCARAEADLFVVYMGNNEVAGLHGPLPGQFPWAKYPAILSTAQWLKMTRLGQLFTDISGRSQEGGGKEARQDMPFFRSCRVAADDSLRAPVYPNFREKLEAICRIADRAGAKVVLATVAVNLKDCPPIGSLHRVALTETEEACWESAVARGIEAESKLQPEAALGHYLEAAGVDDHFAELHFRLARAYGNLGRHEEAAKHYRLGCDWDALQFRSDSRINGIIRDEATVHRDHGVYLADVERLLAGNNLAEHGVPGGTIFSDHVHYTFDGDYEVARILYQVVTEALSEKLGAAGRNSGSLLSRPECADRLAYTPLDAVNVLDAITDMTSRPPFWDQVDHAPRQARAERALAKGKEQVERLPAQKIVRAYREAIARNPNDWPLHYRYALVLHDLHDYAGAIEHLKIVVNLFPNHKGFRVNLGYFLAENGQMNEALTEFNTVLSMDPHYRAATDAIASIGRSKSGKPQEPLPPNRRPNPSRQDVR